MHFLFVHLPPTLCDREVLSVPTVRFWCTEQSGLECVISQCCSSKTGSENCNTEWSKKKKICENDILVWTPYCYLLKKPTGYLIMCVCVCYSSLISRTAHGTFCWSWESFSRWLFHKGLRETRQGSREGHFLCRAILEHLFTFSSSLLNRSSPCGTSLFKVCWKFYFVSGEGCNMSSLQAQFLKWDSQHATSWCFKWLPVEPDLNSLRVSTFVCINDSWVNTYIHT